MAPAYGQILNLTQSIIAYRSCLTVEIILTSGFQRRGKNHFFGLCRRFDPWYLLSKLSRESEINIKATAKNIVEYIYWNMDYSSCLEDGWEELLEIELSDCETDAEIEDYIKELAKKRNVDIGHYEAWECIEKDYPAGAKRIVKIFETYIKPKIPKGEQP